MPVDAPQIAAPEGDAVAIDGQAMSPATILTRLNELGGKHGIGRLDLVEAFGTLGALAGVFVVAAERQPARRPDQPGL